MENNRLDYDTLTNNLDLLKSWKVFNKWASPQPVYILDKYSRHHKAIIKINDHLIQKSLQIARYIVFEEFGDYHFDNPRFARGFDDFSRQVTPTKDRLGFQRMKLKSMVELDEFKKHDRTSELSLKVYDICEMKMTVKGLEFNTQEQNLIMAERGTGDLSASSSEEGKKQYIAQNNQNGKSYEVVAFQGIQISGRKSAAGKEKSFSQFEDANEENNHIIDTRRFGTTSHKFIFDPSVGFRQNSGQSGIVQFGQNQKEFAKKNHYEPVELIDGGPGHSLHQETKKLGQYRAQNEDKSIIEQEVKKLKESRKRHTGEFVGHNRVLRTPQEQNLRQRRLSVEEKLSTVLMQSNRFNSQNHSPDSSSSSPSSSSSESDSIAEKSHHENLFTAHQQRRNPVQRRASKLKKRRRRNSERDPFPMKDPKSKHKIDKNSISYLVHHNDALNIARFDKTNELLKYRAGFISLKNDNSGSQGVQFSSKNGTDHGQKEVIPIESSITKHRYSRVATLSLLLLAALNFALIFIKVPFQEASKLDLLVQIITVDMTAWAVWTQNFVSIYFEFGRYFREGWLPLNLSKPYHDTDYYGVSYSDYIKSGALSFQLGAEEELDQRLRNASFPYLLNYRSWVYDKIQIEVYTIDQNKTLSGVTSASGIGSDFSAMEYYQNHAGLFDKGVEIAWVNVTVSRTVAAKIADELGRYILQRNYQNDSLGKMPSLGATRHRDNDLIEEMYRRILVGELNKATVLRSYDVIEYTKAIPWQYLVFTLYSAVGLVGINCFAGVGLIGFLMLKVFKMRKFVSFMFEISVRAILLIF